MGLYEVLSIVSVLSLVDGGWHTPSLENQQCTAVDGDGSKTYFSHLKKYQYQCTLYLENLHHFTLPSGLSLLHFLKHGTSVFLHCITLQISCLGQKVLLWSNTVCSILSSTSIISYKISCLQDIYLMLESASAALRHLMSNLLH